MGKEFESLLQLEKLLGRIIPTNGYYGQDPPKLHQLFVKNFTAAVHYKTKGNQKETILSLKLSGADLYSVPDVVLNLNKIRVLDISNNRIETIPEYLLKLSDLNVLNLCNNRIKFLPRWLFEIPNSIVSLNQPSNSLSTIPKTIFLKGNPIQVPPQEIIKRGRESVLTYFDDIEGEPMPLNEIKLVLVGDGGAGKTSLLKRILGHEFDPNQPQTEGINIASYQMNLYDGDVKAHIWDFGGQEILHATHQFFLSHRSIYLVVLDGRKEEDPEYWLNHAEIFGGDSPILIALNKIDKNAGFDVNRKFLLEKFPSIQGFHRISCATNQGISSLLYGIQETVEKVEITNTTWPRSWFKVKKLLEEMKKPFFSYDSYVDLCLEHGIGSEETRETLVNFLHDLGIVIHFSDFHLRDTHVLEPQWLTQAVYTIINSQYIAVNFGVLNLKMLKKIIGENAVYPQSKFPYIINIMLKFELCYKVNEETLLIPQLLPIQEPDLPFAKDEALIFHVKYKFLPKSILPRFMVKLHNNIVESLHWRTGMVISDDSLDAIAIVRVDYAEKRIEFFVSGDSRQDYLTVLRTVLLNINRSFESLEFIEIIPLPDNSDIGVSYNHLLTLKKHGKAGCFPDGASREYTVDELLGTVRIEKKDEPKSEEQIMSLLKKVVEERDDREAILDKANDIIMLQPNIMGIGVNINAIVEKVMQHFHK